MSIPAFLIATPPRAGRAVARRVAEAFGQPLPPARRAARAWYDTFDWRLYRAGLVLEHDRAGPGEHLLLRPLAGGTPLAAATAAPTRFAAGLRKRVLARAGERALLPVAAVEVEYWNFEQRDREGAAVLRIAVEALRHPGTRRPTVYARLLPARGHEALADDAARALQPLGFALLAGDPLDRAIVTAGGRSPLNYSARPKVAAAPDERIGHATARVLGAYLEVVRANVDGARRGIDDEFLHDLRTGLRRARTLLLNLRGVVPEPERGMLRREFAWASGITGPARDLDVFAAHLPALLAGLPAPMASESTHLAEWLQARGAAAAATLSADLGSARWNTFLATWSQLVSDLEAGRRGGRDALRPAALNVARSTRRLLDDLLRAAGAASVDTPLPALHELRKTAKKLRYLLEAFAELHRPRVAARAVATLKEFQDELGLACDARVQLALLGTWRTELSRRPGATLWPREFARCLEEHLAASLGRPRRRFLHRLHDLHRRGAFRKLARGLDATLAGA